MRAFVCISFLLCCLTVKSQNPTVGLIRYDSIRTCKGFNLLYPNGQPNVYLLNNRGEIVHVWTDALDCRPGNVVYLLEDGSILKTKKLTGEKDSVLKDGNGATVEKRDWDNHLVWTFTLNDSTERLHHNIEPLPNGNILMLCREKKTMQEAINKGRNPAWIKGDIWTDKIIEIQPIGKDSFKNVWEWHAWDHMVQNFDSIKPKYGNPAHFPNKISLNYAVNENNWANLTAMSFNIGFNQIAVVNPSFGEVWIIDHTTSKQQSSLDYGGYGLRGGDLLFRWGNPEAYGMGTASDRKLFSPDYLKWIGNNFQQKDFGKLLIYNNQAGHNYSTVNTIFPTFDTYFWAYQKVTDTGVYLPKYFEWTYRCLDSTAMYSSVLSSVQRLANGNTLICAAEKGYSFEITDSLDIVWEYRTPLKDGVRVKQGTALSVFDNTTAQMLRYAENFPGFSGKVLSPMGFLELEDTFDYIAENSMNKLLVFPNPARTDLYIESQLKIDEVAIYTLTGQTLLVMEDCRTEKMHLDISSIEPGFYFLSVNNGQWVKPIQVIR